MSSDSCPQPYRGTGGSVPKLKIQSGMSQTSSKHPKSFRALYQGTDLVGNKISDHQIKLTNIPLSNSKSCKRPTTKSTTKSYATNSYECFPPYFDSRITWGKSCWYPVRDQGHCESCYALSMADAVTNRACIATQYSIKSPNVSNGCVSVSGNEQSTTVPDVYSIPLKEISGSKPPKPPPLSSQAILSCTMKDKNACGGAEQWKVADMISNQGLIAEGTKETTIQNPAPKHEDGCCPCKNSDEPKNQKVPQKACMGYCSACLTANDTKTSSRGGRAKKVVSCPWSGGGGAPSGSRIVQGLRYEQEKDLTDYYSKEITDSTPPLLTLRPNRDILTTGNNTQALIHENIYRMKMSIMTRGPITTSYEFNTCEANKNYAKQWKNESKPFIIRTFQSDGKPPAQTAGHSIKIIGWATLYDPESSDKRGKHNVPCTDVWICQNSWGDSWGSEANLDKIKNYIRHPQTGKQLDPNEVPSYPITLTKGYFFLEMTTGKLLKRALEHYAKGNMTGFTIPEIFAIAPVPTKVCSAHSRSSLSKSELNTNCTGKNHGTLHRCNNTVDPVYSPSKQSNNHHQPHGPSSSNDDIHHAHTEDHGSSSDSPCGAGTSKGPEGNCIVNNYHKLNSKLTFYKKHKHPSHSSPSSSSASGKAISGLPPSKSNTNNHVYNSDSGTHHHKAPTAKDLVRNNSLCNCSCRRKNTSGPQYSPSLDSNSMDNITIPLKTTSNLKHGTKTTSKKEMKKKAQIGYGQKSGSSENDGGSSPPPSSPTSSSKSKKWYDKPEIILVVIACVIVISLLLFGLYKMGNSSDPQSNSLGYLNENRMQTMV